MYGRNVIAADLLNGTIPQPAQADPLYRMLNIKFGDLGMNRAADDSNSTLRNSASRNSAVAAIAQLQKPSITNFKQAEFLAPSGSQSGSETAQLQIKDLARGPINGVVPAARLNPPPKPPTKAHLRKAIALFDFSPLQSGDLRLKVGDIIWGI